MALVITNQKPKRKTLSVVQRKPLMLRDYLRDDLSSCSSSGFKSFPRRQCCSTVRFLLETDLKSNNEGKTVGNTKRILQRSRSKAAAVSKTISALQRASVALLHAVKQLPFPSVKSPSSSSAQQHQYRSEEGFLVLPRSLSRKLLKRSFWRKADRRQEHTIKRWKTFREYLEEQSQTCDQKSWGESGFTADVLQSSSGNTSSESSSENVAVESKTDVAVVVSSDKKLVSNRVVGVSVGEDSIINSKEDIKDWRNEEDKEQFSPVSVLDCPFEDEKRINSPPFGHRHARMEGTKQKFMHKLTRFESLDQLEPVDLEKRIASLELDNETSVVLDTFDEDEANETKSKARELLKMVASTTPSCPSNTSFNLLSDFFLEKVTENKQQKVQLLKEAQDWIHGQPKELLMGWEVEDGRKVYITDMEKNGRWGNIVGEEKEDVGLALEIEVFTCLINELVFDLSIDAL